MSTSPAAVHDHAPGGPATWLIGSRAPQTLRIAAAGLWVTWAGLLFGGLLYGAFVASRSSGPALAARMGSSATLVLAGLVGLAAARGTAAQRYAALVAAGMALGFLGDLFNSDLVPIGLSNPVLGGILSFGLGHIAYILACRDLVQRTGQWRGASWGAVAVWQLLGLAGWVVVVYLAPEDSVLKWPALPYSLLLAGTAGVTSGLAVFQPRLVPLALGGALFLISDLILAFNLFRDGFPGSGDAVWLTYGPGQMLIVYSIWAVYDRLQS